MKKRVNVPYLLTYILVAVFLLLLMVAILVVGDIRNNYWIFVPIFIISIVFVLWISLVPVLAPQIFRKFAYGKLAKSGFNIQRCYNNLTHSLLIDITGGKVAMLYSFNPITPYVFSASRIRKIWIDERRRDVDNFVRVLGVKFVVDNSLMEFFTYNQPVGKSSSKVHYPPNHPHIIEARQKAHLIATELNQAWQYDVGGQRPLANRQRDVGGVTPQPSRADRMVETQTTDTRQATCCWRGDPAAKSSRQNG